MKKLNLILLATAILTFQQSVAGSTAPKKQDMVVATYNIRLQTPADSGARSWENRKSQVARLIKNYNFGIVGVQEVGNTRQEAELKALIPGYTYFGKGRDKQDGTEGEQVGILYQSRRFTVRDYGSFFLSETPGTMSIGWDAALRRMCVWLKLYDRQTNNMFFVFCTHFDHVGVKARVESAKLVIKKIKEIAGSQPVLLLGDLNTSPESSEMYKVIKSALADSRELSKVRAKGSAGTFNGYDISKSILPESERIDYIFCSKFTVSSYKVLNDKFSNKTYPSDHFPVMIHCRIATTQAKPASKAHK